MFMLFQKFIDAVRGVEGRLHDLADRKETLTKDLRTLNEEYARMLTDEALGGPVTERQLTAKKAEIEKVEKELAMVNERIIAIQSAKIERLRQELPEMRKEYDRKMAERRAEFDAKVKDMRRMKAEYLLFLRDFGRLSNEMREIHDRFVENARLVSNEYEKWRFTPPTVNLFNDYEGQDKMNAPTEREIYNAFHRGIVPAWVLQYENGEVEE
jgi:hypothetical protein